MELWKNRPKVRRGRPSIGKGETLYIPASKIEAVKKILNE